MFKPFLDSNHHNQIGIYKDYFDVFDDESQRINHDYKQRILFQSIQFD